VDLNWIAISAFCIVVFLVFVFGAYTTKTVETQPTFIFFMTDDQGYGDSGYLVHSELKTSNIDEKAKNGLRLDRFFESPVCFPSRAGVLSGRHPNRFGTFTWGHALRSRGKTIALHLKDAGYQTGFFGKWNPESNSSSIRKQDFMFG